ncbi:MAG: Flp pilus assembly complex ATPase component TadA [Thermoleophilia bacterium]|nr:Flp pilus assembly complex ATPase component TadA [Thermoleophilia bacterium]
MSTPAPGLQWIPLGQLLVDGRVISEEQLRRALEHKASTGQRLGEVVVELGFTTERAIAGALAEQYELQYVDLDLAQIDKRAVALLPEELARRYEALPLTIEDDGTPLLAVTDPTNLVAADDLRFALGSSFRIAVAERGQIELAIARAYRRSLQLIAQEEDDDSPEEERVNDIRNLASSTPTINLVNSLLTTALEEGASDIHFEPRREDMLVRVRVDGVMRELGVVPRHMQAAVTSRLKIMGKLDIADRRAPQDGRVTAFFGTGHIDMRIAVLATTHGEQVVLRILGGGDRRPTLSGLELEPTAEADFMTAIEQPYGTVIVCGPTGSGKTTTLYGALDHLNRSDRVVMTIEDPVEHRFDGVNQIEVDPKGGLTFASGLRTILRSDPDVLLVGEVRDAETAAIAIQAAMTGHLVLTSLHAHNAASAVARLRDMGVDTSMLASSLNAVVAQRLARRLCLHCRREYTASARELGVHSSPLGDDILLYEAVGCGKCQGTGYAGRVALREVMPVQGEVRALVESSTEEIFAAAVRQGMTTLRDDGMRLALAGLSSVEEIRRVTGIRLI